MPIYEYRRPDGTTFEVVQAFSDPPLSADPETGVPVERVLHPPAVHFKGKGFYNTDYGTRKRQREKAASGESGEAGGAAGGASENGAGKSEAKPEPKTKDTKPAGTTS
jgi:putative FmdB family regulatory protein